MLRLTLTVVVSLLSMALSAGVAPAQDAGAGKARVVITPTGALLRDGKPFLPIIVWAQPSSQLEAHRDLGINTMHPGEKPEKDPLKPYLDKLQANGMMALVSPEQLTDEIVHHPAILAWTVEHEPDVAQAAAYQPDLSGEATVVWIEGESPKANTIERSAWLDKPRPQLSGGKWLTSDKAGTGEATWEFEVPQAGTYHFWVREFTKSWANPTRWKLDEGEWHETGRDMAAKDNVRMSGGHGVAWSDYGPVELTAGKHTVSFRIVPGRTVGKANKTPTPDAIWAVDALCFTTGDAPPAPKKIEPTPKRLPDDEEKAKYEKVKAAAPNALTWNILTAGFYGNYNKLDLKWYREFLQWADITSFDHYPVTGWNQPGRLPEVGLATRKLVELARPNQPVWTIVEASDQELSWTPAATKGPTPEEMRAEIWMSIAGGARGIGYFTVAFGKKKNDGFKWNHLTDGIRAEMKRSNAELTALAGPIVAGDTAKALTVSGDETADKSAAGHAIQAIRKEYEGVTYVIAVNVTRDAVTPTFTLADPPKADKATVRGEGRTVSVRGGAFQDAFKPLEVHIYELK